MAFGQGTGSESILAIGEEAAWGTAVTPTEFVAILSETIQHRRNIPSGHSSLGDPRDVWPLNLGNEVGGDIRWQGWCGGLELPFKYMLGDHFTTINPTTGVYQHKFRISNHIPQWKSADDPSFTSLTLHALRGSQGTGAGYNYQYKGAYLNGMRAEFAKDGLTVSTSALFYDSSEIATAPTVTYDHAALPYPTTLFVGIGDPTTGDVTNGYFTDTTCFGASITIQPGLAVEFPAGFNGGTTYPLPLAAYRKEPVIRVDGSMDILAGTSSRLYGSKTLRQWEEQFASCYVRIGMTAGTLLSTWTYAHQVDVPDARITMIDPPVQNPDYIRRNIQFRAYLPSGAYPFLSQLQWMTTNARSGFGGR